MRLLLTSAGVRNPTIHRALEAMLPRPLGDCRALCIPTAGYANPYSSPESAWEFVSGRSQLPMCDLGWRSVGLLELTALPTLDRERWEGWVRGADVLLVGGGDALYLAHWVRESGLGDVLPSLTETVWVGLSAGSMAMAPRIGADFMAWDPPGGEDVAMGHVDFSIFPHLDHPELPENTMADAERWAADLGNPAYAIDDDTAITVVDGEVEVVTEGHWRRFD